MRITTRHPASAHGVPVILDDRGRLVDQVPGLVAVLARLGWSRAEFAERCGLKPRTVEQWFQFVDGKPRRPVAAAALNVLADALAVPARG
jgi:hypothetical protein